MFRYKLSVVVLAAAFAAAFTASKTFADWTQFALPDLADVYSPTAVANLPDGRIGVRNSRDSEGPVLRFTSDEWHAFLGGARNGEFDSFGRE